MLVKVPNAEKKMIMPLMAKIFTINRAVSEFLTGLRYEGGTLPRYLGTLELVVAAHHPLACRKRIIMSPLLHPCQARQGCTCSSTAHRQKILNTQSLPTTAQIIIPFSCHLFLSITKSPETPDTRSFGVFSNHRQLQQTKKALLPAWQHCKSPR